MQDIMVITPGAGQSVAIGPTRTMFLVRSQQTEGRYSLVEHTFPPQFAGPPPHRQGSRSTLYRFLAGKRAKSSLVKISSKEKAIL